MKIISIGEILWDVFEDGERLGGVSFNFSAQVRRLWACRRDFIQRLSTGIGTVTVKLDGDGQPAFTLHRPAAYDAMSPSEEDFAALAGLKADWSISARSIRSRRNSERIRRDWYTPELIHDLMDRANVVKLNDGEAIEIARMFGHNAEPIPDFCARNARRFGWRAVCVTRGADGCAVWLDGKYTECPGYPGGLWTRPARSLRSRRHFCMA